LFGSLGLWLAFRTSLWTPANAPSVGLIEGIRILVMPIEQIGHIAR